MAKSRQPVSSIPKSLALRYSLVYKSDLIETRRRLISILVTGVTTLPKFLVRDCCVLTPTRSPATR